MSTVTCTIDGHTITVPAGTNVIEAAKQLQVEVPHYCYHRNLSVAGNCRMCLVKVGMPKRAPDGSTAKTADGKPEIGFMPKLQIGCATPVSEGMVVETRSSDVQTARKGVMEFLLINHPLDCPICDQAGECRLQEFAVDHGAGESRFVELKVHKPKRVSLGEKIMLDNERCIMCSRCERFMREVAQQDCLGFTQRGSHVELTCYPGNEPKTNYDLNLVDICPVGALTSKDYRFRMRTWFMKETRSVCPGCSRGCNTSISSRDREVYRLTPRDNDAVNKSWMCDIGRMSYQELNTQNRVQSPWLRSRKGEALTQATWPAAVNTTAEILRAAAKQPDSVAVLASARASTEDLYLLAKLAQHLGVTQIECVAHPTVGDAILRTDDGTPNAKGAHLVGAASATLGSRVPAIVEAVKSGAVKVLLVSGENVAELGLSPQDLGKLDHLIVLATNASATTESAEVVLPTATYAERPGTFINVQGRMQRFAAAFAPLADAQPEYNVLSALLAELGAGEEPNSFSELFERMVNDVAAFKGITWNDLGDTGWVLGEPVLGGAVPPSTLGAGANEVSP
jgi:NADH-quinone oxidoreductase subunit G